MILNPIQLEWILSMKMRSFSVFNGSLSTRPYQNTESIWPRFGFSCEKLTQARQYFSNLIFQRSPDRIEVLAEIARLNSHQKLQVDSETSQNHVFTKYAS